MPKPIGLYIHVPFCAQKCYYCDFYSLPPDENSLRAYADALIRAAEPYRGMKADTVYFGGGTPTLPGSKWLDKVLIGLSDIIDFQPESEITLEANPETVHLDMLREIRQAGFNRISFGLQTMEDQTLAIMGRRHTAQRGKQAIFEAVQAGFDNISADLMLGLPGQSMGSALQSIREITALPLQHISAYLLKIEPETPFGHQKDRLPIPDEEDTASLYEQTVVLLEQAGFSQYEISNFAKPGYPSRHNLKYWQLEEYLGLGPAAHSFLSGKRFYYPRSLTDFVEEPCKTFSDGPGGGIDEYIAMSLRLTDGLDLGKYQDIYSGKGVEKILSEAKLWQKSGLCRLENHRLILTPKGFLVSNSIISELLYIAETE